MIRQLLSLLLLLVAVSLAIGYSMMPTSRLAVELVREFGQARTMEIAALGGPRAYLSLIGAKQFALLPWVLAGMGIAILARVGLWFWVKPPATPERMTLVDEAGGTVTMFASPLSHDPGIRFLEKSSDCILSDRATDFENELYQLMASHADLPFQADDSGASEQLLTDHIRSAYAHIVAEQGVGSIAATLLVAHHCGKVLAYVKDKGRWKAVSDKFAQQSLIVVRRVRSFYHLAPQYRAELMRGLQILATNNYPVDLPDEVRDTIRAVRIADMVGNEAPVRSGTAPAEEVGVDIRAIASLVSASIVTVFKDFNVNQMLNKSEALDAIYVKKDGVLLVPPKQMREAFSRLLPPELAEKLNLNIPAASRHPSDQILRQVLQTASVLVPVYKQVSCSSGVYSVRSGKRRMSSMWALSTKNIKQEIIDSWADWSFEVEIIAPGEIHVG